MRILLGLLLFALAGCPSDIGESSFATINLAPAARYSRADHATGSYGTTGVHKWNIVFATQDGCGKDAAATIEINTSILDAATMPMGTIPFRTMETPQTFPTAYVRLDGATTTSGSIALQMDGGIVKGTATGVLSTGELMATFEATNCVE